ncbi:tetratricopeptide repeat protein [Algiphilus sp.]|uniref:tetratricopeptide repeat protein n=1 Tax=Algiphilus sp. TaxID=1872431 RepID=UPI003C4A4185
MLRLFLLPALLLLTATGAGAQNRVELDRRVADAKMDLLQKEAAVRQQELALRFPAYLRTSLYVDKRARGFVLETLRVRVDGREIIDRDYQLDEARALSDDAMQRVSRVALEPGEHDIVIEFSGRIMQARDAGRPVARQLSATFTKGSEALDVIIPVTDESSPVELRQIAYGGQADEDTGAITRVEAGSAEDPRLGHARYLNAVGRNFGALVELQQIDFGGGDAPLPESYRWLMAESYLAFGMLEPARRAFARLERVTPDRDRLVDGLLELASFEYQRGYLYEAVQRLRALRNDVQDRHLQRWQDLTSRVLLAQGRYSEAADVLRETADRSEHTPFMRYNLGIALLNSGDLAQGRSALDEISQRRPDDDAERALRDKANLTLGYHFLREQLGGTAKPVFERVRIDGPFSNRALLGMGWAELAPEGGRQDRQEVGDGGESDEFRDVASLGVLIRPGFFEADIYRRLANRPFRRSGIAEDEEESLLRALVVWNELVKRDPMDAAVQEAMLAIPYALDRLGDYEQALQRYQRAISVFEEARDRIDDGIESVEGALMLNTIVRRDADAQSGYNWRLLDLPDLPETYWLNRLLAEHRFQEQLKNYRDARLLAARISALRKNVGATFRAAANLPPPPQSVVVSRRASSLQRSDLPALRLERAERLTLQGSRSVPPVSQPAVPLREAGLPREFRGRREAYSAAVSELATAQDRFEQLAEQQSESVRELAISDLEDQRAVLEQYLLEARFAVARIYDRRLRDQTSAP